MISAWEPMPAREVYFCSSPMSTFEGYVSHRRWKEDFPIWRRTRRLGIAPNTNKCSIPQVVVDKPNAAWLGAKATEHPQDWNRHLKGPLNDPSALLLPGALPSAETRSANIASSGKPRAGRAFRNLSIASVVGISALVLASTVFTGYGLFQE